MEERLDDAINVLRNHAESQLGLHAIAASNAAAAAAAAANLQTHSNGLLGTYHHATQPPLDPHLVRRYFFNCTIFSQISQIQTCYPTQQSYLIYIQVILIARSLDFSLMYNLMQ